MKLNYESVMVVVSGLLMAAGHGTDAVLMLLMIGVVGGAGTRFKRVTDTNHDDDSEV